MFFLICRVFFFTKLCIFWYRGKKTDQRKSLFKLEGVIAQTGSYWKREQKNQTSSEPVKNGDKQGVNIIRPDHTGRESDKTIIDQTGSYRMEEQKIKRIVNRTKMKTNKELINQTGSYRKGERQNNR